MSLIVWDFRKEIVNVSSWTGLVQSFRYVVVLGIDNGLHIYVVMHP